MSDVSVRVAWAEDAAAVARLQLASWPEQYGALVPADAVPSGPEAEAAAAAAWRTSLAAPGDARNRVLVALSGPTAVGFAVVGPAADPDRDPVSDGELRDLVVSSEARGAGHGSRLLQAACDTLAADRFTHAVTWVAATDDARRAFLVEAGWAADGAHRELALDEGGDVRLRQVRLHTRLV